MKQNVQLALALFALCGALGVLYWQIRPAPDPYNVKGPIVFNDLAQTNATVTPEQLDLTFVDSEGRQVKVNDLRGKKHVVLVMTRGYHQARCPYCTALTSRLISNYQKFVDRGAEVLVVYPGPLDHLPDFLSAVKSDAQQSEVPFPMLYDQDFSAVDQLGIRWELARPSTFIIDKQGNLCFAYIGKSIADRPSIDAMLSQLDKIAATP